MPFAMPQLLSIAGRVLLDYALPPRCPGCGAVTGDVQAFCQPCWQDMRFLGDPCCATCGVPFDRDEGGGARCGACLADPPPWDSARAVLAYGEISGTVAMRLKYGRRTGLARLMARHMASLEHARLKAVEGDVLIIPVPLHRWRLWSRGFNQSALIARHLSASLGIATDPFVLKRMRATRPLRDLNSRERERTVAHAFALDTARVSLLNGKTVLLIDDVHTSGATARACTKVLKAGGALEVHLLCWARTLK